MDGFAVGLYSGELTACVAGCSCHHISITGLHAVGAIVRRAAQDMHDLGIEGNTASIEQPKRVEYLNIEVE